jgi:hypothetical protein
MSASQLSKCRQMVLADHSNLEGQVSDWHCHLGIKTPALHCRIPLLTDFDGILVFVRITLDPKPPVNASTRSSGLSLLLGFGS